MAGKKKSKSPVRRFRDLFGEAYLIGNVESRKGRFISEDLYGWGDLLLLPYENPGKCRKPLVLVQVTSSSNRASRRRRIIESESLPIWLADRSRAAWLATAGTKKKRGQEPTPVIRVTTFTLGIGGAIIEADQWYDG